MQAFLDTPFGAGQVLAMLRSQSGIWEAVCGFPVFRGAREAEMSFSACSAAITNTKAEAHVADCFHSSAGWKSEIRVLAHVVADEGFFFLACRWLSSHYALT